MTKINAYLTLVLAVAFAAAPFVTSPFSGFTADQLPIPQIDPPVQPAGYAFAIWGVIYAGLVASGVFGAWKRAEAPDWTIARPGLILSLAVGVPWLAIANASAIWATVTILIMAAGAILALLGAPDRDTWWFRVPVGLYAGWLTAASAVSVATVLAGYGIAFGAFAWAFIAIIAALAVAVWVQTRRAAGPAYGAAVAWALVGVMVNNGVEVWPVTVLAGVGVLVMLGLAAGSAQTA